ncbi:hypothetical protein CMV30_17640 [Nibricoccus aquaticus]|uniref:TonB C-terminal domain-containing protein n=1 Tax=Nibricoccus aquaticus TaxID=2576891 RepID=A0A290QAD3_9BACT|nr:energy transducer TonB [Nibricoccus aquaticus]ATC65619.1 hypothetical protein CMV30_17640 [Nibricoccus aquaticus]
MSRPFTLPVVIACSAHALLMFGFTKPSVNPPIKPPVDEHDGWVPVIIPAEEIEKPEPVASLEKQAGGKLAAPMPLTPDKAADKISPDDLLMVLTESDPLRVKVDTNIISPGPGSPNGDPDAREYGPGTPDGKIIFAPTALDNTPRTRVQNPPSYPFSLKSSGVSGEVLVEFVVDEHGRVINPRVLRSTHADFEAPTLSAVSKWRFEPGTRNMAPVRFKMVVPVKFSLNE